MSQQENIMVDLPNASARAGYVLALSMCSKVLWDTAIKIKNDPAQGFSERLAIVKVLKEIHDQIKAEME